MELQRIVEKAKEEADTNIHKWKRRTEEARNAERVLQLENDALKRELDELRRKQIKKEPSSASALCTSTENPPVGALFSSGASTSLHTAVKIDSLEDFDVHSAVNFESGGVKPKTFFKCVKCPRVFRAKSLLEEHHMEVHNRLFSCTFCKQKFGTQEDLKKHKESHKVICLRCGNTYRSPSILNVHMKNSHN